MEQWEKDGVQPSDDWSSLIFIRIFSTLEDVPERKLVGYLLVIERARQDPKYKLPGGHKQAGETPLDTAVRETFGETGLAFSPEAFTYVNSLWITPRSGNSHWSCLFVVDASETQANGMHERHEENEGEEPESLTTDRFYEFLRERKILGAHVRRREEAVLILPLGRAA